MIDYSDLAPDGQQALEEFWHNKETSQHADLIGQLENMASDLPSALNPDAARSAVFVIVQQEQEISHLTSELDILRTREQRAHEELCRATEQLQGSQIRPHYHVAKNDGTDDCKECGLDLRDEIHFRANDPRSPGFRQFSVNEARSAFNAMGLG